MTVPAEEPLKRDIGFLGSAFLSFNGLVGAGIFVLPGTLFDRFGAFSPLLFPLFGTLFLVIAVPFARVTSHFPATGGPVAYAAPFGRFASFQAGWLYYVARVAALAANATVFATYLSVFWPAAAGGIGRAAAILAMVGLTTAINVLGVRRAVRVLDALTLLKAAPLLLLAIWACCVCTLLAVLDVGNNHWASIRSRAAEAARRAAVSSASSTAPSG